MRTAASCEPCADQVPLLQGLLDGELDAANALQAETHLRDCRACADYYGRLQAGRQRRRQEGVRHRAPDALRDRVRAAVAAQAAASPAASPVITAMPDAGPQRRRRFVERGAIALALAACLAVIAVLPRGGDHGGPALPDELVSGHVRSLLVSHLTDVATSDQHGVKPWFSGKVGFAPPVIDLSDRGFALVGGRLDYIGGQVVAAIVYKRREHVINLFVWPGSSVAEGARSARTSREGYSLLHWTQAGLTFWAVSDLNPTELQEFEQDFAARAPS
ncbi:anti-sigma factor family protein [Methylobacterium nodulans]|uniref:Putative transmembrane anti-sigma factor n=1 Tax=Methylobacterium nodulans (strain LMG 21967 / CNCM I-2342 / ORS 2060) TaxID=460265 RepID=B8IFA7_METNO|nr:anti-sigma factor [Methylobacterium nodulans]ACL55818.1 putative transmembrane anti-sigma factor [Methylobacterium nodulans ORS 2060]